MKLHNIIRYLQITSVSIIFIGSFTGFLYEVYEMFMQFKIELADLTAAAHISCIDYLGDMPWEKFPEIKHWYSRIKSRPSFRSILTDKIIGIPPRGNYALLDF